MAHRCPPRRALAACAAALLLAGHAVAACPPPTAPDAARVEERVSAAVTAEQTLDTEAAIGAYVDALRAVPWADPRWREVGVTIALRLARRHEMLQRPAEARDAYGCFLAHAPDDHPERSVARGRVEAIDADLAPPPTLTVRPLPATARITVDGLPVSDGRWSGPVPPGRHTVEATAEGFVAGERTVDVQGDVDVELRLIPRARLRIEVDRAGWRARLNGAEPVPLPLDRPLDPGAHTLAFEATDGERHPMSLDLAPGEVRTIRPPSGAFDGATFVVIGGTAALVAGGGLAVAGMAQQTRAERLRFGGASRSRVAALDEQADAFYLVASVAGALGVATVLVGWSLLPAEGAAIVPTPGGVAAGGRF